MCPIRTLYLAAGLETLPFVWMRLATVVSGAAVLLVPIGMLPIRASSLALSLGALALVEVTSAGGLRTSFGSRRFAYLSGGLTGKTLPKR